MNRTIITSLGFALMLTGFVALFLSLVGIRLTMLAFLDNLGGLWSFLVKIIMIVFGFVLIYVGKSEEIGIRED